ncbi:MAG: flagellar protein FlaG [Pseudomonadota bacterium]
MVELPMDLRTTGIGVERELNTTDSPKREKVIAAVEEIQEKVTERTEKANERQEENKEGRVSGLVDEINQSPVIKNTSLKFVFDERGDPPVVQVIDKENGETIRQIPSELAVKLSQAIEEMADSESNRSGFLFDKQV